MDTNELLEKTAKDYAGILRAIGLDTKLEPIARTCDDLLLRLDEFEALLGTVKADTNGMQSDLKAILGFSENFEQLQQRIDQLAAFAVIVNRNLDELEERVDTAEAELNVRDYSLRGLIFKPLLATRAKPTVTAATETAGASSNVREFQPVAIFKASDFFADS